MCSVCATLSVLRALWSPKAFLRYMINDRKEGETESERKVTLSPCLAFCFTCVCNCNVFLTPNYSLLVALVRRSNAVIVSVRLYIIYIYIYSKAYKYSALSHTHAQTPMHTLMHFLLAANIYIGIKRFTHT